VYYLGIDVGSVSTDFVVMDEEQEIVEGFYLETRGNPLAVLKEGIHDLGTRYTNEKIAGAGVTGSGRALAAQVIGADIVKNEITAHAAASAFLNPKVKTVIEIGGQDSKMILIEKGMVKDFAMNTVCAAGTGSFIDRQAERLGVSIDDIGKYALRAESPVRIAGRCAVFAESDLVHKQQIGCDMENIIAGMCEALVTNYLANVAKGKKIEQVVCFQGGVAANQGIKAAFEKKLGLDVVVPKYHKVMGAFGSALLARDEMQEGKKTSSGFRGFDLRNYDVTSSVFECRDCSNQCEIIILAVPGRTVGCFADRCGKYQQAL
jgi:predicted CoA-substrate-specific enzyme activase